MHDDNAYITLTYDDANVPPGGSLRHSDYQKFMKRLRKCFSPRKIKYYMCGEYGENLGRPHFHACLFGLDFSDRYFWQKTPAGHDLFRSPLLERLWPCGMSTVGTVTFESAQYVTGYIMKKMTGNRAKAHYEITDPDTGEIIRRVPEYCRCSNGGGNKGPGGIGATWFAKWSKDIYPHDYAVVNGVKSRPPRYYDKLLAQTSPETMETIKSQRVLAARVHSEDQTPERLATREVVAKAASNLFPRQLK